MLKFKGLDDLEKGKKTAREHMKIYYNNDSNQL